MHKELLKTLVEDADLVADVGVRLGRIKSGEFLTALSEAKHALDNDGASPEVIAELQKWLNSTIHDMSPITLHDLRAGWRPFDMHTETRLGTIVFFLSSLVLIFIIAYLTEMYNRAASLYTTTVELQETRGTEQTIRLFGLLRKNPQGIFASVANSETQVANSGTQDLLDELFNKGLSDLEMMNVKFLGYTPIAVDVLNELDISRRLRLAFFARLSGKVEDEYANPTNNPKISEYLGNYGKKEQPNLDAIAISQSAPVAARDVNHPDTLSSLEVYIDNIRRFAKIININIDPIVPSDFSFYLYKLRDGINTLGLWMLPSLYGMLGAIIFHMRRLLDPTLPNPSWMRVANRIVLAGFAGIIVIWFLTPSSQKLTQPGFATITSFGLAFLIGFSTDIFFQALDRLVNSLSQAIGQTGT